MRVVKRQGEGRGKRHSKLREPQNKRNRFTAPSWGRVGCLKLEEWKSEMGSRPQKSLK